MANTNIPNNPAFFVSGVNQGTSVPVGPQEPGTIEQIDANGKSTLTAVTYPAPAVVAAFAIPAHASGPVYSFVVPFACQVVWLYAIKTANAGGAGDALAITRTTLAGSSASLGADLDLHVAAAAFVPCTTLIDAARTLAAGEVIVITPAQSTDVGCTVYATLLPV